MKINVLIDTWEMNSAGKREITNPSERPNRVYDVKEGEKVVVIQYGDGSEEFSFTMENVTDNSVTIQCFQPLFILGEGSGDLTRFTIEEGKETVLDTTSKDFGFRFTVTLVKGETATPMEEGSESEKKKLTSVQYRFSVSRLVFNIFYDWENFDAALSAGPNKFKEYLVDEWNKLKAELIADPELELRDGAREVSVDDFDITINKTKKERPVFFITLPDYDYRDATGKYIALALLDKAPRYFILEYSEDMETHEPAWVIGELRVKDKQVLHKAIDVADNMRITWFAGFILGLLDEEE